MIQETFQINVKYIFFAVFQFTIYFPQGVFAPPAWSKSVAVIVKPMLKYRFQNITQYLLHHPVTHCRNTERTLLPTAGFFYIASLNRLRFILPV
jgi:hypothetical protein